jgi:two-component system OmpR family response regulator
MTCIRTEVTMPIVSIVDDESQIRELLARWIGAEGHHVREAATAAAALEDMQVVVADVVLCDVMLPGESGLWLTGQIRAQFPATAVVLVTAVKTVSPQVSMQPGVVAYLAKPFTREDVLGAVKLGVGWHMTAVSDPDLSKTRPALPKAWVGSSGT